MIESIYTLILSLKNIYFENIQIKYPIILDNLFIITISKFLSLNSKFSDLNMENILINNLESVSPIPFILTNS